MTDSARRKRALDSWIRAIPDLPGSVYVRRDWWTGRKEHNSRYSRPTRPNIESCFRAKRSVAARVMVLWARFRAGRISIVEKKTGAILWKIDR